MKVLGLNSEEKIIVEITKQEFANVLGYSGTYDDQFRTVLSDALKNGTFLNVSKVYKNHSMIKKFQGTNEVELTRRKLLEMVDALTRIDTVFDKIPETDG